ncbi:MAG: trypsin-like peptidase domain-containing protein [Clostridiales bacterium]|nr:trypsin-like peptidase domain-containing protein [Clostridiales bacterium]
MKWVKRIVMIVLALGIVGSGILAFLSYNNWKDADKEVTRLSLLQDENGVSIPTTENQKSVVLVACMNNQGYGGEGTGYAVGEYGEDVKYIVTNGHVVSFMEEDDAFQAYVFFGKNDYQIAEVVFYQYDKDMDMAILKLPKAIDERIPVAIRDSDDVDVGDKCVAIGFPDKANNLDTNFTPDIASQTVTAGVIGKVKVNPAGKNYKSFQHDAFITHGNSGGPLFDEHGFLIGMNTEGREDSENVNFSIMSNEITKVLKKNKIKFMTDEDYIEEAAADKKASKGKKSELSKKEDEAQAEKTKFFVFLGVGAACAVALLVLAILGNKKVVMVGEQDDGKKSYLTCTKGIYAGQKFEFTDHTMTIGRDRNTCTFVFPENTPGISSNHCSVYFDPRTKSFVLTDNGSTYGTYLSDGRKLTKGVPEQLTPGSVFSLADKTNEFLVERE